MKNIRVGDAVVAIRNGGHDHVGLPVQRPLAGSVYRVTSVYQMRYGLGCTLRGLDPYPYRGYFLYVKRGSKNIEQGWYFEKLAVADPAWTETLYELLRSKDQVT